MNHALNCLAVVLDAQTYEEQNEISRDNVQIPGVDVQVNGLSEACRQTCDGLDYVPDVSRSYVGRLR